MNTVGAALGHHAYLRSGGTTGIRVGVAGGNAELLDRVERRAQGALECVPGQLVIVVQTVEGYVGLVATRSCHRTAAAVSGLIDIVSDESDAGLQTQNGNRVTAFRGKINQLCAVEYVPLGGVGGIHH